MKIFRLLAVMFLITALSARNPAAAQTNVLPNKPAVPDSVIAEFKAQIPALADDKLPYRTAVSRLRTVLRVGEDLERSNPDAPNLYVVRGMMLDIARRLAALEADEASQTQVMDIARRIVLHPGPPENTIWADVLLTQSRLARLSIGSRDAAVEINAFVARYADSPVAQIALMFAVDMATNMGNQDLTRTLTSSLFKYHNEPVVEAFLRDRGEQAVFNGSSLNASLKTLDGKTLQLPHDLLGKVTVLHFWSLTSRDIPYIRALYDRYHDQGLEIIGVNVDRESEREKVKSFIRQQGLAWPQVFTGKGLEDPLKKRLGVTDVTYYWVIGRDGRIVQANVDAPGAGHISAQAAMIQNIASQLAMTDLAERVPYYRSGEFLARTPLLRPSPADRKDSIPQAALDAVQTKLLVSLWEGISREEKIQSFKEVLAAGQSLEQSHPEASDLALVRSWMLIAARWLAVTTGDKAFADQSVVIANRLLASDAAPASRFLADYTVTSAQLAGMEPRTKAGARLIQDYAARNAGSDTSWVAKMLAVMLTLEDAQDVIRETLVEQLRAGYAQHADPIVYGFIRDDCGQNFPAGIEGLPLRVPSLTRMDGRPLSLPGDLLGKVVILQFWSAAHPPKPEPAWVHYDERLQYTGLATVPSDGVVVVGINLDRNRADAEAFLKKNPYPDWIHTFSGLGWDDPTARACDILALPRLVALNRDGNITIANQSSKYWWYNNFREALYHGVVKQPWKGNPQ